MVIKKPTLIDHLSEQLGKNLNCECKIERRFREQNHFMTSRGYTGRPTYFLHVNLPLQPMSFNLGKNVGTAKAAIAMTCDLFTMTVKTS